MIKFEEIVNEKNKEKRDTLIKRKLEELNNNSDDSIIKTRSIVNGFINKNSIVHFSDYLYDPTIGLGYFYYVNSEDYFYEFFDFLSKKNINNKSTALRALSSFIKRYLGETNGKNNDRDKVFLNKCRELDAAYHSLPTEEYYKQVNEFFSIGSFKGKSYAECTEHAVLAQNLLTICDINSFYVTGAMNYISGMSDHAFNIFELDGIYCLFDPTNPIQFYDSNYKLLGFTSLVKEIPIEEMKEFINCEKYIDVVSCNYKVEKNKQLVPIDYDNYRYYITGRIKNKEALDNFFHQDNISL